MSSQIDSIPLPKPKFGLGIVCYENCDFIFNICAELRPICDYILIGWQTVSYSGKELSQEIQKKMKGEFSFLEKCGLIDEVIIVSNTYDGKTTEECIFNEKLKRNTLYYKMCDNGMDYCLISDSDELHFIEDVEMAISFLDNKCYNGSYTYDKCFIKDTSHELIRDGHLLVNFVQSCKNKCSAFIKDYDTDDSINDGETIADYTRTFHNNKNMIVFNEDFPAYHFAFIRDDIEEKISNYSQPLLMSDEKSANMIRKALKDILILDKISIFGVDYDIRKCSYPVLDEKIKQHKKLREKYEKLYHLVII